MWGADSALGRCAEVDVLVMVLSAELVVLRCRMFCCMIHADVESSFLSFDGIFDAESLGLYS